MTLFDNKYRIESARREGWDYADNGYYFVTICTKDREHFFGEIENGEMILNEYGKIVQEEWEKSFEIRKELFCDAFIIMPNHIHGIVILEKDDILHVKTHGRASVQMHDHLHGATGMHKGNSANPRQHHTGKPYNRRTGR